jgi:cell wall-associated NlpC family hydrolase
MRYYSIFWRGVGALVVSALLILPGNAARSAKPRAYTVRQGDTLGAIAHHLGVDVRRLAHANGITNIHRLHQGQVLRLPGSAARTVNPQAARQAARTYTVKQGDTLGAIAQHLGVNVRLLAHANGITNIHRLHQGQALRLPGQAEQVAAITKRGGSAPHDDLVKTALNYRGVPYRWAGVTSRGMDCSGFVLRVLKDHGIAAPHNAAALYQLGKPVSDRHFRPGDLLFFHTTRSGISHVGIYIGDGKFVHASSHTGRVTIDRIDQGYYQSRFVGAKRLK